MLTLAGRNLRIALRRPSGDVLPGASPCRSSASGGSAAPLLVLLVLLSAGLAQAQDSGFGAIWNQAVMEYEYADPEVPTGRAESRWVPVYLGWFPDVPPDHWAFDEVMACVGGRVVFGYTDGLYRPWKPVNRDQMAVYIARAICGGDDNVWPAEGDPTFPDVPATGYGDDGTEPYWAFHYIEFAVGADVVEGYPDGNYHPTWSLSRAQMAVFIARARRWISIEDTMSTAPQLFPDVPAGYWAGSAILACQQHEVVEGYPDGYYRPAATVTRDQMAVYIARAFTLIAASGP